MKPFRLLPCLIFSAVVCGLTTQGLPAKPPAILPKKTTPEPAPTPSPAPAADASPNPLACWLLQQNGSRSALSLSLADLLRAATGKKILPIDSANADDAAVIAKIGAVLDRVLPGMNKSESPAHVVGRTDEVAAFFEDALRAFAATVPGLSCPPPSDETAAALHTANGFPAVRLLDAANGKSYYLGVTLYPTGGREAAVRALHLHPADAAARMTEDGSCLLVAIETNGKSGKEIAFLNWELLDLTKLQVRVVTTFEATQGDVHPSGTLLNDGRKGRD